MKLVFCHNTSQYLFMHYADLITTAVNVGYHVICVAPQDGFSEKLRGLGAIHQDWKVNQHGMNPLAEVISILQLRKVLKHIAPDMILSFSIKPNLYIALVNKWKQKYQQFCMVTGLGYVFIGNSLSRKLFRQAMIRLYRFALSSVKGVFFQNPADRDMFCQLGILDTHRSTVIPGTGISTDWITPDRKQRTGPLKILFIGRLLRDKGVVELVEAARALRSEPVRICLLGPFDTNPGGLSPETLRAATDKKEVEYLGETQDVRPYLHEHHVFILPSYREGMSRSILEAMAAGLPIIASDVPGCRDLVKHRVNGLLVPPRDGKAIAEAIRFFIDNPGQIDSMGRASRCRVEEEFDVVKVNLTIFSTMELSVA